MLVGAGLGTWLAVIAEDGYLARAIVVATAVAAAALVLGLALKVAVTIPAAIVLLGAAYVAILVFEADPLDVRAAVVAAALLAVAELAYWSLELRGPVADEPGTGLRRLAFLATLLLGTTGLGVVVLVLVQVVSAGGPAVDLVGAAAAIGALALLALAARRTGH